MLWTHSPINSRRALALTHTHDLTLGLSLSRYEWFDNEDCEQTFSEFCADTSDDDVFLFSIYFAETRNIRFVEYHYALNCTKFIYHQIRRKKCSIFLVLNDFLNRWTKQICFFIWMFVNSISRKLFYLHHRTWMKSRSNAQNTLRTVEHVNEMKQNDRTNVKGIRYTTRSYANWNSNMSKQTVCVKPKQKFHFMPTPTNGNEVNATGSRSLSRLPLVVYAFGMFIVAYGPFQWLALSRSAEFVGNILCAHLSVHFYP